MISIAPSAGDCLRWVWPLHPDSQAQSALSACNQQMTRHSERTTGYIPTTIRSNIRCLHQSSHLFQPRVTAGIPNPRRHSQGVGLKGPSSYMKSRIMRTAYWNLSSTSIPKGLARVRSLMTSKLNQKNLSLAWIGWPVVLARCASNWLLYLTIRAS